MAIQKRAVDEIACKGDVLMYGGKRGEAAQAFGHLARAVAVGALLPGGITFAGRHWCTDHAACRTAGATP